jgi:lipoprotein signal peptidase
VIGEFGMAFGITIVIVMFVGKIEEKSNDLNACSALKIILGARNNLVDKLHI